MRHRHNATFLPSALRERFYVEALQPRIESTMVGCIQQMCLWCLICVFATCMLSWRSIKWFPSFKHLPASVCVDLWSMEERGWASTATAAVWADAHQYVHVHRPTRRSGGKDHQTQSTVCWCVSMWDAVALQWLIFFWDMCTPLSLCHSTQEAQYLQSSGAVYISCNLKRLRLD